VQRLRLELAPASLELLPLASWRRLQSRLARL